MRTQEIANGCLLTILSLSLLLQGSSFGKELRAGTCLRQSMHEFTDEVVLKDIKGKRDRQTLNKFTQIPYDYILSVN